MGKMIFMSHPLNEATPSYGDRDKLSITSKSEIKDEVGANTSTIYFSNNHMGTHFDSPYHFCSSGRKTLDYGADEFYYNRVAIIKYPCTEAVLIKKKDLNLKSVPKDVDLLFIDTEFEIYRDKDKYHNDNPGLDASLANELRNDFPNLKAVGFDFISLTSWKFRPEGRDAHRAFLCGERPLLVIEDVSFAALKGSQIEWVVVAPLRTEDGNGGPVTIIASLTK